MTNLLDCLLQDGGLHVGVLLGLLLLAFLLPFHEGEDTGAHLS